MNFPVLPESVDVCARTLWGEARGAGVAGMSHVAMALMNRVRHPGWWGHDVISVCQAPYQFSCWNADDPNRPKLLAVTASDPQFAQAIDVAEQAIGGSLLDATGGADSYYARSMVRPPRWAATALLTFEDAWHRFYRTVAVPTSVATVPNVSIHAAAVYTADQLDAIYNKELAA